ncbi:MAG: homoserine O-succinyltransferase, partial [Proteobacteria bacterium]|nr:homoserine O-succinyltransferase [Pseudomonadota bacterium]
WKSPRREDVLKCKALEVVADSEESGPNIMAEAEPYDGGKQFFPRRLYILNHPEYETETLQNEYRRDSAREPATPLPQHYFSSKDASVVPPNTWRHAAHIYTNWIKAIY